jgi:hypothetical protein
MKILLANFNAKMIEDMFKATIGNGSLHEPSINNGERGIKFFTSKILVKSKMFPNRKIQ